MLRTTNICRPAAIVAGALASCLMLVTVQRAFAVTTVPSAIRTSVTVASLGFSQFAVVSKDTPVLLQIATTTPSYRGVAYNHYNFAGAAPATLAYVGTNSYNGAGYRGVRVGTDPARIINYLGASSLVLYSVNDGTGAPAAFRIQNNAGSPVSFTILQTW